jgi:hypothetical protein
MYLSAACTDAFQSASRPVIVIVFYGQLEQWEFMTLLLLVICCL